MRAFLTGSRAYGNPHSKSDIDLVMFVDGKTKKILEKLGGVVVGKTENNEERITVKFGQLNLILETKISRYDAWFTGTEYLKSKAPVSRDKAIDEFEKRGIERWYTPDGSLGSS